MAAFVALFFTISRDSPITWIVLGVAFIISILGVLFDPDTCIQYTEQLADGTEVKVKQPLIGFKKYETLVGVTGDYEVGVDGWRRERALLRL